MSIPEYKMVPAPIKGSGDNTWYNQGCEGCDFRYMREVKCSAIDCRPRSGVPVIAKIIQQPSQL